MNYLRRVLFSACLVANAVVLASCSYFGGASKAEIASGQRLFQMHCAGCHNGKPLAVEEQPPNLNGIFQRSTLPSGAPATDAQVRSTIMQGRSGIMPPFANVLSSDDIRDIIAYLHTLKSS